MQICDYIYHFYYTGIICTDTPHEYLLKIQYGFLIWSTKAVLIWRFCAHEAILDHYVFVYNILICIGSNCAIGILHARAITRRSNAMYTPISLYSSPIYYLNSVPKSCSFIFNFLFVRHAASGSGCVYMNRFKLWSNSFIILWRVEKKKRDKLLSQERVRERVQEFSFEKYHETVYLYLIRTISHVCITNNWFVLLFWQEILLSDTMLLSRYSLPWNIQEYLKIW